MAWWGRVELDPVAVFGVRGCGLGCFDVAGVGVAEGEVCLLGSGSGCFGACKVQRGFDGFVEDAGIEVRRAHNGGRAGGLRGRPS